MDERDRKAEAVLDELLHAALAALPSPLPSETLTLRVQIALQATEYRHTLLWEELFGQEGYRRYEEEESLPAMPSSREAPGEAASVWQEEWTRIATGV